MERQSQMIFDSIVPPFFGVLYGVFGGILLQESLMRPQTAYLRDVNGDGRDDIVLRNNKPGKNLYVFLAQPDGSFKALDQAVDEQYMRINEAAMRKE